MSFSVDRCVHIWRVAGSRRGSRWVASPSRQTWPGNHRSQKAHSRATIQNWQRPRTATPTPCCFQSLPARSSCGSYELLGKKREGCEEEWVVCRRKALARGVLREMLWRDVNAELWGLWGLKMTQRGQQITSKELHNRKHNTYIYVTRKR